MLVHIWGKIMKVLSTITAILLVTVLPGRSEADASVESNVIYGMYSGLALLMDVHYPEDPNGYGLVEIGGSGFHALLSLDTPPLSDQRGPNEAVLVERGYTVFSINHRAAPRFRYPAAVEDVRRAVRYIRHHADRFQIDPNRIGALGGSSGGHLALMAGLMDGDPGGGDSVDGESSKVQAVVAMNPPTDFVSFAINQEGAIDFVSSFLGVVVWPGLLPDSIEASVYAEASPINYVSPDDPPVLLIHGDADDVVPYNQSELLRPALSEQGVTVELISIPGGGHGGWITPELYERFADWFDLHLRE